MCVSEGISETQCMLNEGCESLKGWVWKICVKRICVRQGVGVFDSI